MTIGEPLPLPREDARLWRCGLLAKTLSDRGHSVVWWSSSFDHIGKRFFSDDLHDRIVLGGVSIRLLHGVAYRRNVSIRRLLNHVQIAMHFRQRIKSSCEPPDLIVASFPTIELASVSVRAAIKFGVPCVVDVRDLWPDIFLRSIPTGLGWIAGVALLPYVEMTRSALSGATALTAVSSGYLDWALKYAGRRAAALDRVFPLAYQRTTPTSADLHFSEKLLGQSAKTQIAVFAGSFGRTYDLGTVIEAARILESNGGSNIRFVLCGTGERESEWRRSASGVSSVIFTGLLAAGQLAAVMEKASIGLAAYAKGAPQGIPNKLVEYAAYGLPVVSSLSGEAKQLIESNRIGVSYSAGDPCGLAARLRELEASPASVSAMATRARSLYDSNFGASAVVSDMAAYLEDVVRFAGRRVSVSR